MTARAKIEFIDLKQSFDKAEYELIHAKHRWLPVVEGGIDQIIGFLCVQDCIALLVSKTFSLEKIRELAIEPYFIPEKTPLSVQYRHFHREFRKIGLVVNEYGGLLGLISTEDILNHLSVEDFSLMESSVYKESTHEWVIPGDLSLSAFRRVTGLDLQCELASTIGGALIEHLERVPDAGTDLEIEGIMYEVLQTSRQQILKIRVTLPSQSSKEYTPYEVG
jgi:Mg2+/Co2+ transporter CorB